MRSFGCKGENTCRSGSSGSRQGAEQRVCQRGRLVGCEGIPVRARARFGAPGLARHRGYPLRGRLLALQAHGRRHRRLLCGLSARRCGDGYHVRPVVCPHLPRGQDHLPRGTAQQRGLPSLHLRHQRFRGRLAHLDLLARRCACSWYGAARQRHSLCFRMGCDLGALGALGSSWRSSVRR